MQLDTPITNYLPDFTVNSIFEEQPERQITLRHLLSHTAGFTHEAPVGNNWDADTASFEAHIHNISDTWLRFPVGTGYAYSNLGIVVLSNSSDQSIQATLSLPILYDLTHQAGPYHDRMMALPSKNPVSQGDEGWQPPASLAADIASRALPANLDDWQSYQGEYLSINLNALVDPTSTPSRVYEQAGALYIDWNVKSENDVGQYRLYEIAPGLFFTETGQALDFRSTPPTFRNNKLKKVGSGPSTLAWGILAASGLVMLSVLLALPGQPIWRRLRRLSNETHSTAPGIAAASTVLTVVGSLFGLVCICLLAAIPRLIYAGFLGWFDLPLWQKLLFHAPLGLAVCTVALVVMAVPAWRQAWWRRGQRWHYTALVVAALAETALLAGWQLIGLG